LCALAMMIAVPVFALTGASPFAFDLLSTASSGDPQLWLAQRSIERQWVTPDDPSARATVLPGGKSEMGAMSLSALFPGVGQLYTGEKSGYAYVMAEVLSWAGLIYFDRRADDQYDNATATAGAPTDSSSAWSFKRYAAATGNDPSGLEKLYSADPSSFWYAVSHDDQLAAGWSNGDSRSSFSDELARSNTSRSHVSQFGDVLWLNHLVSAADAFRAARIYNLPLQRNLELKTKASLHRGRPEVAMTLVRTF
jgi:hypothetical protein